MKIVATFDTKEKTLEVSVDGKAMENVSFVEMARDYYDEDKFQATVSTFTRNEDEGVATVTRLVAHENELLPEKEASAKAKATQLVTAQISDFFRN